MDSRKKWIFSMRIGILTLTLFTLALVIYFMCFYKPFKPVYGDSNELVKSIEQEQVIITLILIFGLCIIVSLIILIIYNEIEFYNKPIITVSARLVSKELAKQIQGDHRGFSNIGYAYKLTFKTESGVDMDFQVSQKHYFTILEGNKGVLKYKQGISIRFIGFDIQKIE